MAYKFKTGTPFLYDEVTGDIVGWRDPDGDEHLFAGMIVTIDASTTLTSEHDKKILRCTAAVTLTYPEGLGAEFSCLVESPASGDVTIDPTGTCTVNGATDSLTRGRTNNPAGFVIRALAANVAGVSGS